MTQKCSSHASQVQPRQPSRSRPRRCSTLFCLHNTTPKQRPTPSKPRQHTQERTNAQQRRSSHFVRTLTEKDGNCACRQHQHTIGFGTKRPRSCYYYQIYEVEQDGEAAHAACDYAQIQRRTRANRVTQVIVCMGFENDGTSITFKCWHDRSVDSS